ncbi:hypothetical protein C8Q78DRAFT_1141377 [Trametes maxima]|nr:hypothetical protein C8Q78DRAFT_1141377 [Trametes maxima]
MPFSRYLGDAHDTDHDHDPDPADHNLTFSTQVHFQLPNLILNAPTVPPGGGAEALPAGLYPPSSSLSWFASPVAYGNPFSLPSAAASYSHHASSSSPQSAASVSYPLPGLSAYTHSPDPNALPYSAPPHIPLSIPSALGLPVYSSSGFDVLSILGRVANRPFPKVYLGPVDLSCSFVVTDTRRFDSPVVYASPTFYKLTGYDEHEVIGRNCRFLQAPGGNILRGQDRVHTASDAVAHLRKNIIADKECQVSIINYRKDGSAFINMVSVIPIRGGVHNSPEEADDIVFHVGFQVDLSEQPKAILGKLKDGTYLVNYSENSFSQPSSANPRDWRTSSMSMRGLSKDLRALLADSAFTGSFQLSTSTHASTALALSTSPASEPVTLDPYDGNKPLHMFLLDRSPDFLHVVSLKGAFLYAAPAVRSVLGYDPDELVGRSLAEFCHPADCVPLMRELKEASATPGPGVVSTSGTSSAGMSASIDSPTMPTSAVAAAAGAPRLVDLLFRIQAKGRGYVWIECRGRLHVEPGKGRKAIILSGRLRHLPTLAWGPISRAGGLVAPLFKPLPPPISSSLDAERDTEDSPPEREFWGMLSTTATFLYAGAAVRDVLGWGAGEVIGKPLADFVSGTSAQAVRDAIDAEMTKVLADSGGSESAGLACDVHTKDRGTVPVHIVLYRSYAPAVAAVRATSAAPALVVCQVKLCEGTAPPATQPVVHAADESVFEETHLDRGSSWQYELQQLKFRNQRLVEEIAALEAAITKKIRRKQSLGLGPLAVGGSTSRAGAAAAGRMPVSYQHQHPAPSSMQPQAGQPPLNVRFVSGSQGVPPLAPPSARSQPPPAAQPVPGSSMIPPVVQMPPPPSPRQVTPSMASPAAAAPAYVPTQTQTQARPQMPPVYHPRVRRSFDSSLQGWSHYGLDQGVVGPEPGGGGGGAGGGALAGRTGSFGSGSMPMKRAWDSSMRDPGGGGGGGGGGGAA